MCRKEKRPPRAHSAGVLGLGHNPGVELDIMGYPSNPPFPIRGSRRRTPACLIDLTKSPLSKSDSDCLSSANSAYLLPPMLRTLLLIPDFRHEMIWRTSILSSAMRGWNWREGPASDKALTRGDFLGRFDFGNALSQDALEIGKVCSFVGIGIHLAEHVAEGIEQWTTRLDAHCTSVFGDSRLSSWVIFRWRTSVKSRTAE